MKILFIITGLGIGGAETQLIAMANKLSNENDITIISLTESELTVPVKNRKINILNLSMKRNFFSFIYSFMNTIRIIKK